MRTRVTRVVRIVKCVQDRCMAQSSSKDVPQDSADRKNRVKVRLYVDKDGLYISRAPKSPMQILVTYSKTPPTCVRKQVTKGCD